MNPHCNEGKLRHTYHIKVWCEMCDTAKEVERTYLCLEPSPRLRLVGCKECERFVNMIFRCSSGGYDHDFGCYKNGNIYAEVDNIDA